MFGKYESYLDKAEAVCDIGSGSGYFFNIILQNVTKLGIKCIASDTSTVIKDVKSSGKDTFSKKISHLQQLTCSRRLYFQVLNF